MEIPLKTLGRKPSDIKKIILTHAHQSHLGGLAALKAATGARVYSHIWEADVIEGKRKVQVPSTTTLIPENLKDGDTIGPLTVLGARGHTPGSLSFYWPEKKALVAGDIVVTWPVPALGWPQITLDNKQNRESVGKLSDMVHAEILCVGHGLPIIAGASDIMRDLVAGRVTAPQVLQ